MTITGITGSVNVSISGAGSPQISIGGGAWTSGPATITNGQTLELRLTSNAVFGTMNSATVTVGTVNDQWDVTTVAQDTTPNAFNFTDQTGVAVSTLTASNSLSITGITGSVAVTISGAGSPQFRIASGAWGTTGNINNGETLELRLTSNAASGTMNSATVTVGTGSDQWDVTTAASCSGYQEGGYCWYFSNDNESCNTTCANQGGTCNLTGTRDYTGSGGSDANCQSVGIGLGLFDWGSQFQPTAPGQGCAAAPFGPWPNALWRQTSVTTTCTAAAAFVRTICACD